jgi:hypothetical protein
MTVRCLPGFYFNGQTHPPTPLTTPRLQLELCQFFLWWRHSNSSRSYLPGHMFWALLGLRVTAVGSSPILFWVPPCFLFLPGVALPTLKQTVSAGHTCSVLTRDTVAT